MFTRLVVGFAFCCWWCRDFFAVAVVCLIYWFVGLFVMTCALFKFELSVTVVLATDF